MLPPEVDELMDRLDDAATRGDNAALKTGLAELDELLRTTYAPSSNVR